MGKQETLKFSHNTERNINLTKVQYYKKFNDTCVQLSSWIILIHTLGLSLGFLPGLLSSSGSSIPPSRHSYAQHFCIQLSHYTGEGFRKNYEGSLHHVLHHGRHQHTLVKDLTLTTTTNPKHFSQILGYPKNINKSAEGHSKHIYVLCHPIQNLTSV